MMFFCYHDTDPGLDNGLGHSSTSRVAKVSIIFLLTLVMALSLFLSVLYESPFQKSAYALSAQPATQQTFAVCKANPNVQICTTSSRSPWTTTKTYTKNDYVTVHAQHVAKLEVQARFKYDTVIVQMVYHKTGKVNMYPNETGDYNWEDVHTYVKNTNSSAEVKMTGNLYRDGYFFCKSEVYILMNCEDVVKTYAKSYDYGG